MRLLHIIATADPKSGGPIEGIIRQNEATHGVREIVSCDPPNASFLEGFPLKVHALGQRPVRFSRDVPVWRRYSFNTSLIPWLRRNAEKYDAVVVNGLWNFATFAAARVLPKSRVPYFVFTHGMMDPWFRHTYPVKHGLKQLLWLFSEGRLLNGARAVLFTTDEERLLARRQFIGWTYRECVTGYGTAAAPPYTPDQLAAFSACVPSLGPRPYLLFLSRIHPKKGIDLLIEAFSRCAEFRPELALVIAGPDESGLMAELMKRTEAAGIAERVFFPGMLSGEAKWGALYGAEAFVLPSHQENFGIAVAEALACGVPVLISNKVNIWREISDAGAGIVADDNVDGTTNLIQTFISLSDEERAKLRISAQRCFDAHFNISTVAPKMLVTLEKLSSTLNNTRA